MPRLLINCQEGELSISEIFRHAAFEIALNWGILSLDNMKKEFKLEGLDSLNVEGLLSLIWTSLHKSRLDSEVHRISLFRADSNKHKFHLVLFVIC